jgi:vacuolar-type H+-ATPase subunit F/Vma7
VFDTLILRLEEVDNLNRMRCDELSKQKSPNYQMEYERKQNELEIERRKLYDFESKHDITSCREELQRIKDREKSNGEAEGKQRKYFKKGSYEHTRKQELKQIIEEFEKRPEYDNIRNLEAELRNYQSGGTQFDTSINEQFNRISEQLNDLVKRSNNFFLSQNNKQSEMPDLSFKIDLKTLAKHYFDNNSTYNDFSIQLPETLVNEISKEDAKLLIISLNAVLSFPQGRLGNYSEENILKILIEIGNHLSDSEFKDILREYYKYRIGKSDSFIFPTNTVLANLIVFFMKLQGHDQINKMLINKGIQHKQLAFMLYGAYSGFANMPKTFTNLIFDSENEKLLEYIDNYLFNNFLNN